MKIEVIEESNEFPQLMKSKLAGDLWFVFDENKAYCLDQKYFHEAIDLTVFEKYYGKVLLEND